MLELAMKRTEVDVLKRFTRAKTLQDLESKLKAAQAKMLSDKAALDLEEARLTRLKAQAERCVIRAPADGMVIYPQTALRTAFGAIAAMLADLKREGDQTQWLDRMQTREQLYDLLDYDGLEIIDRAATKG